jgi:predicted molibdopterin-dependent oxidoreductase YjgC
MTDQTATINGQVATFESGETIFAAAERLGVHIPTLCHDPRLKPAGACRTCLVEIKGRPKLVPACATSLEAGMEIDTENERVERHVKTLLSMYLADHDSQAAGTSPGADGGKNENQLLDLARRHDAPMDWPTLENIRKGRPEDLNPYVAFEAEKCIACARCVRYCAEVESVSAITMAERGGETTVFTSDGRSLMDTTCELCGGCIDTCPTGAMTEKKPLSMESVESDALSKVRTTCNYCGVGCQMDLNVDVSANDGRGKVVKITSPKPGTTTNDGNLCVKGRFAYDFIDHSERLTTPLVRDGDGQLREATWDEAYRRAAEGLLKVAARHGNDSLGFVSSSRCTMEENFLMQKLSRTVFHTNNIHQCAAT